MYALADPNTTHLLRALSLEGSGTPRELAARLGLRQSVVRQVIHQALAIGVVRRRSDPAGHYEIVPTAVAAVVARHRESLLGATA